MTDFHQKFQAYSNAELLTILENADDYQPSAVEAAQTILIARNLSNQDMEIAKAEVAASRRKRESPSPLKNFFERNLKTIFSAVWDAFYLFHKEAPSTERIISAISVVLAIISLFQIYSLLEMLVFMFRSSRVVWDITMAIYLLPPVIFTAASILFYKRRKSGWILMAGILTYSAISAFGLLIKAITWESSGSYAIDNLIPRPLPITTIFTALFFAGTLWTTCKAELRLYFEVDKPTMHITIGLVIGLTSLVVYAMFF